MNYADIIIRGGTFFSGKDIPARYDYIIIVGNRIHAMGNGDGWKNYKGSKTREIILTEEQLVLPGFHDAHLHLLMSSLNYNFVDLIDAVSEDDAARRVYDFSQTVPEDQWVIGMNWYHMGWNEKKLPTKESIDKYIPNRPVFLANTEVHGAWVNSCALELIGINEKTPDPKNGEIVRDSNGNATGFLNENAMGMAAVSALKFSIEREKELIRSVMKKYAERGVTAVQDMRPELGYDLGQYEAFHQLSKENNMDIRVHSAANLFDDIRIVKQEQKKYNDDMFRICLLKMYMDGVPTTHTAMTIEPYKNRPDYNGKPINDISRMKMQIEAAHKSGLSVRIHCCGDGAVKETLDIYEDAMQKYGKRNSRHAIEHVEIIKKEDILRMQKMGIIASMQPEHMVSMVEKYDENPYVNYYSEKQLRTSWNFRTLLDNNVMVAFGTDCPVVDINPMNGIYRAVTRRFDDGNPPEGMYPEQKISVAEAIHCYTYGSAYAVGREHELGTLEPGKYADIAILDTNILKCQYEKIKTTKVLYTVMNGRITYDHKISKD